MFSFSEYCIKNVFLRGEGFQGEHVFKERGFLMVGNKGKRVSKGRGFLRVE